MHKHPVTCAIGASNGTNKKYSGSICTKSATFKEDGYAIYSSNLGRLNYERHDIHRIQSND